MAEAQGLIRCSRGFGNVRLQGENEYQELAFARQDSDWRLGTGLVHSDAMWQGRGWLITPSFGPDARMRLGWNGLADLKNRTPLSQGPLFQLSSPCDCLDLAYRRCGRRIGHDPIFHCSFRVVVKAQGYKAFKSFVNLRSLCKSDRRASLESLLRTATEFGGDLRTKKQRRSRPSFVSVPGGPL